MNENDIFNIIDCVNVTHDVNKINNNINSTDYLKVLCLNIRNKMCDVKTLITSYDFTVHIIVLSEIFIYSKEKDCFELNNYKSYFQCRDTNRGGGVVVYVIDSILLNNVHDEYYSENHFIIINLPSHNMNLMAKDRMFMQ